MIITTYGRLGVVWRLSFSAPCTCLRTVRSTGYWTRLFTWLWSSSRWHWRTSQSIQHWMEVTWVIMYAKSDPMWNQKFTCNESNICKLTMYTMHSNGHIKHNLTFTYSSTKMFYIPAGFPFALLGVIGSCGTYTRPSFTHPSTGGINLPSRTTISTKSLSLLSR